MPRLLAEERVLDLMVILLGLAWISWMVMHLSIISMNNEEHFMKVYLIENLYLLYSSITVNFHLVY